MLIEAKFSKVLGFDFLIKSARVNNKRNDR